MKLLLRLIRDLVPTSSRPRPRNGDDLRNRPRPSSPSPEGTRSNWSPDDELQNVPTSSQPRDDHKTCGATDTIAPTPCSRYRGHPGQHHGIEHDFEWKWNDHQVTIAVTHPTPHWLERGAAR